MSRTRRRTRRPGARYGSAEHFARISAGLRRYNERRREAALVRPAHVDQWLRSGVVAPNLRPILKDRASQVEDMIEDLGGAGEATSMERRVLDTWLQAQVCADVLFQRLMQNPKAEVPDKLLSSLNTSRSALIALGLHRRARDITPTLAQMGYVETVGAPEDEPGSTIDAEAESSALAVGEGGSA